jgi:hypothetical protein
MSGFSVNWLALREPVDHISRHKGLEARVATHFEGLSHMHVLDLASGTGSNLRALAPALSSKQTWTLVDADDVLLHAARHTLLSWADEIVQNAHSLILLKGQKKIHVHFNQADLAQGVTPLLTMGTCVDGLFDLVTASAWFDLVSQAWIEECVTTLAAHRLPLYTVLTYDGGESWDPSHAFDSHMHELFHQHQSTDKGMGVAVGIQAEPIITELFRNFGYTTLREKSIWELHQAHTPLIQALRVGIVDACLQLTRESKTSYFKEIHAWDENSQRCNGAKISHFDFFSYI